MDDNRFIFVTKFRIDNLEFSVFANKTRNYFVLNRSLEDKTEVADFYTNFDLLFSVFSDELSPDQIKDIQSF